MWNLEISQKIRWQVNYKKCSKADLNPDEKANRGKDKKRNSPSLRFYDRGKRESEGMGIFVSRRESGGGS